MKSIKRAFFYGFLLWLIPFVVAVLIFPIRESNRPLFESIMPVVITQSVIFFSQLGILENLSQDILKRVFI